MIKRLILFGVFMFAVTLGPGMCYSKDAYFNPRLACSSFLNKNPKYIIHNIFDGDVGTCWAEGAPSDGSSKVKNNLFAECDVFYTGHEKNAAEQFVCHFATSMPFNLTKIRIYNGYGKSEALWHANNRVKTLALIVNGYTEEKTSNWVQVPTYEERIDIHLEDKGWNDILVSDCLPKKSFKYIWGLQFFILETYKGDKFNDTCISEIEFYNHEKRYNINQDVLEWDRQDYINKLHGGGCED